MKAIILAAGLGTRLRPYTRHRPKALFTLNRKPVLALAIEKIRDAGFQDVMVNTHHCHDQIEAYLAENDFGIAVQTRHEPEILGTGGALCNVADYWQSEALLVINADIVTDIDLAAVYEYHQAHDFPVTMVMHHYAEFNSVGIDEAEFVTRFQYTANDTGPEQCLAFTGIHVLDPRVLDYLPASGPADIIRVYGDMLATGESIKAYIADNHTWHDIGTPRSYRQAVVENMTPLAFATAFGVSVGDSVKSHRLHGDGSDRQWYRIEKDGQSLIMADHGLLPGPGQQEVDAYVAIGRHLSQCGVPVPHIHLYDRCSGLVFVEDLGENLLHGQLKAMTADKIHWHYCQVIDHWITMAVEGCQGFDPAWTYQSSHYDRRIILDNECRYFMEAFICGHLGWDMPYDSLAPEFEWLADQIEATAITGFMHRDLQSRNIMINSHGIHFIDFQGGRLGPLQYDLASLLIDPYAALPQPMQDNLFLHAANELQRRYGFAPKDFSRGYDVCALSRNLQILGAFAFLTDTKGKTWFADYIPMAIKSLNRILTTMRPNSLPGLSTLAEKLLEESLERG